MRIKKYIEELKKLGACSEAIKATGKYTTSQKLWDDCGGGDWMLWLMARTQHDRKQLVLAACACARLSLKYVPAGEDRPRIAIETAEKWARDEGATLDDVRAAYVPAACVPAATAAGANAANAAYGAAFSATEANAAFAAAAIAAKNKTLKKCADIVRGFFPKVDKLFKDAEK